MTKQEMQEHIKKLEDRIAALEARPVYVPVPQPYYVPVPKPPNYWDHPWWITHPYTTTAGDTEYVGPGHL